MRSTIVGLPVFTLLILLGSTLAPAQTPLQTAFTYQGVLSFGGAHQTGTFDFEFRLYDQDCQTPPVCGGNQVGPPVSRPGVAVTNGLFTVEMDFGNVFTGDQLWLEPRVNYAGMAPLRQMPRQRLSANPYALYADKSDWFGLSNVPAGFADNVDDDTQYSAGSGLSLVGATFSLATGGVSNTMLATDSVTSNKIQDGTIAGNDIANTTIAAGKLSSAGASNGQVLTASGSSVVWGSPAGGLTLPFVGTVNAGSNAFFVTNTGNGTAGHFIVTGAGVGFPALFAEHHTVGYAIRASQTNSSGGTAVFAESYGTNGVGVMGQSDDTTGSGRGVLGWGTSPNGHGVYCVGRCHVTGTLSKTAGSFKIDHPLDPENKYLYHSFVESPDMMNVYNGNAVLDDRGEAEVSLPEWFEALNRDFRYQLTAIGGPAPNIHVAEEVAGNRFRIAGGPPRGKVSWQVTGIRRDAYAEAHRIPVEEDKPEIEKGYYLHPDVYSLPKEKSIDWMMLYRQNNGG